MENKILNLQKRVAQLEAALSEMWQERPRRFSRRWFSTSWTAERLNGLVSISPPRQNERSSLDTGGCMRVWVLSVAMTGIVAAVPTGAQTGPAEQASTKVELDQVGSIPGRLAMYQRTATQQGDRLFVEGLDMLTPVIAAAEATDPSVPLHLALYKDLIKEPVRTGVTDAQGRVIIDFRTYPKINISVTADQPTQYLLAVWTGPKRTLDAPSPFVTPNEPNKRVAGRRVWMWGGGTGLLLIALTIAWLLWRSRKNAVSPGTAASIVLALLMYSAHAMAQTNASAGGRISNEFGKINLADTPIGKNKPGPLADLRNPAGKPGQEQFNRPRPADPSPKPRWGEIDENRVADLWNFINAALAMAKFLAAHPEDFTYEPQLAPPGMPQVPLQCASQYACRQCFQAAYDSLTETRKWLENNRIVLANYKNYMQRVEDAGRAVSGLGMPAGALFIQNKAQWDAQRANVERDYDKHYTDLMNDLQKALREIEKCELEVNNFPDWYNRSGFIYYEFMVARYRR